MAEQNQISVDRRSGSDRRKKSRNNVSLSLFGGRRKSIRRKVDKQKIFLVDQYSTIYFSAIVIILTLSALDVLLTLFLLDYGAFELNPIMAFYIQMGPYWFLTVKYALTSIGIIILLMLRGHFKTYLTQS